MSHWHSANIIQSNPGLSQLWRLSADGERFVFAQSHTFLPSESYPAAQVGKDWRSLFRRTFNVAWLPPEKVYLRAIHLPTSDPAEILSMVEIQLEKLSPLPVAQVVWSFELLPKPANKPDALQTVVVIVVARSYVEEYLGGLEAKGFVSDRLEVPSLDQLLVTKIENDGVWIYAGSEGEPALIAWWYGGILQNIALLALTSVADREALLKNQLEQMAWAGELDGWLTEPPQVHLVAQPSEVAFWEPLMRAWSDQPLQLVPPVPQKELAALSAARAARADSKSNLLPPEFTTRYNQQFVDGLWMRGLMVLLGVYFMGVVIYLSALFVLNTQLANHKKILEDLNSRYTDAQRDKARIAILKDRQELKYAALDCWKAAAEALPEGVTLDSFQFRRGHFDLNGTSDRSDDVTDFNAALRKAEVKGERLFTEVTMPGITARAPGFSWSFQCFLKGGDQ